MKLLVVYQLTTLHLFAVLQFVYSPLAFFEQGIELVFVCPVYCYGVTFRAYVGPIK